MAEPGTATTTVVRDLLSRIDGQDPRDEVTQVNDQPLCEQEIPERGQE